MSASGSTQSVLIAHERAEVYADLLAARMPGLDVRTASNAEAPDIAHEADAIVTIGRWMTPEVIARCTRLRWIQCLITGTDHLAPLLDDRPDIVLTNARGVHGPQMSETAMLHMLTLSRGGRRLARQQAAHAAERFVPMTLAGRTVVIVGVGTIAEHFAGICKAFGMHVVGVSSGRGSVPGFDDIRPRPALAQAAADADFVVCFIPLTPDTRHIIDASILGAMKPGAFLVNMARGGIVDEKALVAALESGSIAGAALDVFEDWPLPPESPLWDIDTLLVSPFIGGQSDRYEQTMMSILVPNLTAFAEGRIADMTNRVTIP